MSQMVIARDSNLRFLPLVYFLPWEMMQKCPTLKQLPRKVREVMYSDPMMEIVDSDQYLSEILDAGAALVFPHFGFPGWKEHYTGYFPAWKLAYSLPLWCKGLEKEIGWNLQALMNIPSSQSIPYFEQEYIASVMKRVTEQVVQEQGWSGIFDALREMPCEEDYEDWYTNVRKDFIRKWYHTRSKWVQTVSLEACAKEESKGNYKNSGIVSGVESGVIEEDYCRRFKDTLAEQDREILELRLEGLTYQEIAEKLDYKNHSGPLKRMWAIGKALMAYEQKDKQ